MNRKGAGINETGQRKAQDPLPACFSTDAAALFPRLPSWFIGLNTLMLLHGLSWDWEPCNSMVF
jgi:hypothetical protein